MYYYSIPYYTDRISQMSQEIGIDPKFKEHLAKYGNFWKNKTRTRKFKEISIDNYTQETIDIGLMAVLVDVKTPNFEEIVKSLIARIQNQFHVSAAEIAEQDTHHTEGIRQEIIVIGVAAIVPNQAKADRLMESISPFFEGNTKAEIIDGEWEIR